MLVNDIDDKKYTSLEEAFGNIEDIDNFTTQKKSTQKLSSLQKRNTRKFLF
jgi:hypothetical protein